ncbi:hypothetical protein CPB83DRAFT_885067 [Crepidotus variabilis]|uniref:F-box domain-containing protein n=1 Tax=Crepidotus variabilis TaxID=179855 RepID=A0A9P6EC06_9AGAR|nr:hypothetical protein CPB83DRAFT_885067 [Crepidotus variabilis]
MHAVSILTIPLDVLTTILGILGPLDAVRARQTCKHIRDACLRHTVWANILCEMMLQHDIHPTTYPLRKLNQETLEHLVLCPRKFRQKLEDASEKVSKSLSPISAQYALYDPTEAELEALGIESLLHYQWLDLCPGGRYMMTSRLVHKTNGGSRWTNFFQLWDLGIVGVPQCTRVVAGLVPDALENKEYQWEKDRFSMGPWKFGNQIVVRVHRQRLMGANTYTRGTRILINLSAIDPRILHSTSSTRDRESFSSMLWCYSRSYGIWRSTAASCDPLTDTSAKSWKVLKPHEGQVDAITVFGDRLLVLKDNHIAQWSRPITSDDPNHIPVCTYTNLICDMNASDVGHRLHLTPFNPWSVDSPRPDFMVLFQAKNLAVYRMEAHPVDKEDTKSPDIFPRCIQKHIDMYDIARASYSPARACDGQLIFTSCDSRPNTEIRIHIAPTDTKTNPVGCVKTKGMGPRRITASQHVLCPATGRMCVLTSNNEMMILDFVEPPNSLTE